MEKIPLNLQDFFYQVIAIYKFDPDPDFRFLCEHGAWLQTMLNVLKIAKHGAITTKVQFTGTGAEPNMNR